MMSGMGSEIVCAVVQDYYLQIEVAGMKQKVFNC